MVSGCGGCAPADDGGARSIAIAPSAEPTGHPTGLAMLEHLAKQLLDALACRAECLAAGGRGAVDATAAAVALPPLRAQVPLALHAMEDRIERSGAEPVAVARQLVDHRLAEDRPFGSVVQQVEADQTGVE